MTIQTEVIKYSYAGVEFEGVLVWDDELAGLRPGVAIAHTWAGRGELELDKAVALAKAGYVGFAMDLYGGGKGGGSTEGNLALMTPLMQNRELLQQRLLAGLMALKACSLVDGEKLAAIGFCFGGLSVLDLARMGAPVEGVVSFHGLFGAPENTKGNKITAKVLVLHGYSDPMVPPDDVLKLASELTDAGADWQLHAYGHTYHGFTNPAANNPQMGTVYNASADRRSWQATINFLDEIFKG